MLCAVFLFTHSITLHCPYSAWIPVQDVDDDTETVLSMLGKLQLQEKGMCLKPVAEFLCEKSTQISCFSETDTKVEKVLDTMATKADIKSLHGRAGMLKLIHSSE